MQVQAPGAVSKLILYGREVPGLLPDVRDRARLAPRTCLPVLVFLCSGLLVKRLLLCGICFKQRLVYRSGCLPLTACRTAAQHDGVQPFADSGRVQQLLCGAVHAHRRQGAADRGCALEVVAALSHSNVSKRLLRRVCDRKAYRVAARLVWLLLDSFACLWLSDARGL